MKPLITIIHPTARVEPSEGFPEGWMEAYGAWLSRCSRPSRVEYRLAVHSSRIERFWKALHGVRLFDELEWGSFTVVENDHRDCVVDQGNAALCHAVGSLIVGSQDDQFPPQGWDDLLLNIAPHDIGGDYVLHCSTGSPRDSDLFIPQVFGRKRYERYGYGLNPAYESMFADDEFTAVAKRDGVVINARHIHFEHRHPAFGTAKWDDVYQMENDDAVYARGKATFERRKAENFA